MNAPSDPNATIETSDIGCKAKLPNRGRPSTALPKKPIKPCDAGGRGFSVCVERFAVDGFTVEEAIAEGSGPNGAITAGVESIRAVVKGGAPPGRDVIEPRSALPCRAR